MEASADLGASPAQTFRRVTLPLSLPGVINGITLVFLPAVSSFFIPKLLGGGQYFLIGNMIENQFKGEITVESIPGRTTFLIRIPKIQLEVT